MQHAEHIDRPLRRHQPASVAFSSSLSIAALPMRFSHNEEIYGEGEDADCVYRVISGAVRVCAFDSEGRRLIEGFYMAGDLFGFESGKLHQFSAEAISDCEIAVVQRSTLERAAASDREAAVALWTLTSEKLRQTNEHLMVLGKKRALDRVVAFLLQMVDRANGGPVDLPMSRTDIADYLGLTIETVSRSFSSLERARVIALNGARHFVFNGAQRSLALAA
jgi:CRP/FNR family nitrogen fixation transcriptional regulator